MENHVSIQSPKQQPDSNSSDDILKFDNKNRFKAYLKKEANALLLSAILMCIIIALITANYLVSSTPYFFAFPVVTLLAIILIVGWKKSVKPIFVSFVSTIFVIYLIAIFFMLLQHYNSLMYFYSFFVPSRNASLSSISWCVILQVLFAVLVIIMYAKIIPSNEELDQHKISRYKSPAMIMAVGTLIITSLMILALLFESVNEAIGNLAYYIFSHINLFGDIWG